MLCLDNQHTPTARVGSNGNAAATSHGGANHPRPDLAGRVGLADGSASASSSSKQPPEAAGGKGAMPPTGGRNGPGRAGREPALGSNREYFHPEPAKHAQNRREIRADQRAASAIYFREYRKLEREGADRETLKSLPAAGVGGCGLSQIAGMETLLQRGLVSPAEYRAFITGVQPCGLRWVCQHCAKKAAENDRQTINAALAAARGKGLIPVMLTLTTRHSRQDEAEALLAAIAGAEQRMKRLKAWQRLESAGYARVLEWTYGKNGHHPHFHSIIMMRAESEAEAVAAVKALQPAYMGQLERAGRDGTTPAAWKRSFQVQGAAAASSYLTKWGAAEELTGAQHKDEGQGLNAWQLLRLARKAKASDDWTAEQARAHYGGKWWEIMRAVKGKAQLYKSEGFKALAAEYLAENPPEEPPEPETLMTFGTRGKGGGSTRMWGLAAPRILAIKETAERIQDAAEAAAEIAARLRAEDFPTDGELLDDEGPDLLDDEETPTRTATPAAAVPSHATGGQEHGGQDDTDRTQADTEGEGQGGGMDGGKPPYRGGTRGGPAGLRCDPAAAEAADRPPATLDAGSTRSAVAWRGRRGTPARVPAVMWDESQVHF